MGTLPTEGGPPGPGGDLHPDHPQISEEWTHEWEPGSHLEAAEAQKGSTYSIHDGVIAWQEDDGNLTPIPTTADQFDPALGASVRLNRYVFFADGHDGKWTKNGDIWKYKTEVSAFRPMDQTPPELRRAPSD